MADLNSTTVNSLRRVTTFGDRAGPSYLNDPIHSFDTKQPTVAYIECSKEIGNATLGRRHL